MRRHIPTSALRGPRQFVLAGALLQRLTDALGSQKNFGTLRDFLRTIGQWCWEHSSDGLISRSAMRNLPLAVQRRTMEKHLAAFVKHGILIPVEDACYVIAHYRGTNLPRAKQQAAADAKRAADAQRKRQQRARERALRATRARSAPTQVAQCVHARAEKSAVISRLGGPCHT